MGSSSLSAVGSRQRGIVIQRDWQMGCPTGFRWLNVLVNVSGSLQCLPVGQHLWTLVILERCDCLDYFVEDVLIFFQAIRDLLAE
jgi:hypothetical protein